MKGRILAITLGFMLVISAGACKKKEDQPIPRTPMQGAPVQTPMSSPMSPQMSPHGNITPKAERKIVVPDDVKAKWRKVKFEVEDKDSKKIGEYTVSINSEFIIPGSNIKIVVSEFLPDFKMDEFTITSSTANPNNPAVRVEVFEDGKGIFKGWLYSKFPTIHPFEHKKYGITLKEGVKG